MAGIGLEFMMTPKIGLLFTLTDRGIETTRTFETQW
jgi:hypothetical protein